MLEEGTTTCGYARSEKSWIEGPQGIRWETSLTIGESTTDGADPEFDEPAQEKPAVESGPAKLRACGLHRLRELGVVILR